MAWTKQENEFDLLIETGSKPVAQGPKICINLYTHIVALITGVQQ